MRLAALGQQAWLNFGMSENCRKMFLLSAVRRFKKNAKFGAENPNSEKI